MKEFMYQPLVLMDFSEQISIGFHKRYFSVPDLLSTRDKREVEVDDFVPFSNPITDFSGGVLGKFKWLNQLIEIRKSNRKQKRIFIHYLFLKEVFLAEFFGVSSIRRVEAHHAYIKNQLTVLNNQTNQLASNLKSLTDHVIEVKKYWCITGLK